MALTTSALLEAVLNDSDRTVGTTLVWALTASLLHKPPVALARRAEAALVGGIPLVLPLAALALEGATDPLTLDVPSTGTRGRS